MPPVSRLVASPVQIGVLIKEAIHHTELTGNYIEGENAQQKSGSSDQPNGDRRWRWFNVKSAVQRTTNGDHQSGVDEGSEEHAKRRSDMENEAFTATEITDGDDGEDDAKGHQQRGKV